MSKKLSRYAQKRRQGLVPFPYGPRRCVTPPVSYNEGEHYQREQALRDRDRKPYIGEIRPVPILHSKAQS